MQTYRIDDQHPTVTYNGTWLFASGVSPNFEYNGTVSSSTNVGDYFTVPFRGTSISIFVTFDTTSGGVEVTLSIDNNSTGKAVSQAGLGDTHQQQLWRSETLTMSNHTLLVNMTKVNPQVDPGEGTIWFDYFMVTDPTRPSSATSTSPTTQSSGKSNTSTEHTRAIVGGVIGGLLFLLGISILFFFRRKRKEGTAENGSRFFADTRRSTIEPFLLTTTEAQTNGSKPMVDSVPEFNPWTMVSPPIFHKSRLVTSPPGPNTSNELSSSNSSAPLISYDTRVQNSQSSTDNNSAPYCNTLMDCDQRRHPLQVDGAATSQAPQDNSPAPSNQNLEQAPLQHVDSGIRATAELVDRVELPPVYSQS